MSLRDGRLHGITSCWAWCCVKLGLIEAGGELLSHASMWRNAIHIVWAGRLHLGPADGRHRSKNLLNGADDCVRINVPQVDESQNRQTDMLHVFCKMHSQLFPSVEGFSTKLARLVLWLIQSFVVAPLKHDPDWFGPTSLFDGRLRLLLRLW